MNPHRQMLQQLLNHQRQQIANDLTQQENQFQQLPPHNQNYPNQTPAKLLRYEPVTLDKRLKQCILDRKCRPADNNIIFWKNFVAKYFTPGAKNIWCLSSYGNCHDSKTMFYQAEWNCGICGHKPGRGLELPYDALPRLLQMFYDSGTLEEDLVIDLPCENQNDSGQVILYYADAIHKSVYDDLSIMRDGQLRVVFNPDQKISSWEFCVRKHDELITKNHQIAPKFSNSVGNYGAKTSSSAKTTQDMQDLCESFQDSSVDLAENTQVPMVLGFPRKFVRCLQTADVVNSMKSLIDYSIKTGTGPMESFMNSIRGNSASVALMGQQRRQPYRLHNAASTSQPKDQSYYIRKMGLRLGEPSRINVIAPINPTSLACQESNAPKSFAGNVSRPINPGSLVRQESNAPRSFAGNVSAPINPASFVRQESNAPGSFAGNVSAPINPASLVRQESDSPRSFAGNVSAPINPASFVRQESNAPRSFAGNVSAPINPASLVRQESNAPRSFAGNFSAPINPANFVRQESNAPRSFFVNPSSFSTFLSPQVSHACAIVERPKVTNENTYSINRGNSLPNAGISNNLDTGSMVFSGRGRFGHAASYTAALPTNSIYMEEQTINQQEVSNVMVECPMVTNENTYPINRGNSLPNAGISNNLDTGSMFFSGRGRFGHAASYTAALPTNSIYMEEQTINQQEVSHVMVECPMVTNENTYPINRGNPLPNAGIFNNLDNGSMVFSGRDRFGHTASYTVALPTNSIYMEDQTINQQEVSHVMVECPMVTNENTYPINRGSTLLNAGISNNLDNGSMIFSDRDRFGHAASYTTALPPNSNYMEDQTINQQEVSNAIVECPMVTNEITCSFNRGNPSPNTGISNNLDTSSMVFSGSDMFGHAASYTAALPTNSIYMEDQTINQQEVSHAMVECPMVTNENTYPINRGNPLPNAGISNNLDNGSMIFSGRDMFGHAASYTAALPTNSIYLEDQTINQQEVSHVMVECPMVTNEITYPINRGNPLPNAGISNNLENGSMIFSGRDMFGHATSYTAALPTNSIYMEDQTINQQEVSHVMVECPMVTNEITCSFNRGNPSPNTGISNNLDTSSMVFSGSDMFGYAASTDALPTNSNFMEDQTINQHEEDFVNQFFLGEELQAILNDV